MSSEDVEEARQLLLRYAGAERAMPTCDELRQFLKASREARIRNPEDIANYGSLALRHYKSQLAEEELWLLHEQVGIALMECGALQQALPLVKAVLLKFPGSIRARRLQGMYYQAAGKPAQAQQLYEELLSEQPHNDVIPKQLVVLHREAGALSEAISVLVTYLQHYSNDREAWEELADCYLEAGMYRQAAFALEEVLTMGVLAPLTLIKYGDTLASIGGAAQLRTARAYYAKALQVSGGRSVRALYGLIAVANQLPDKDAGAAGSAAQELPSAAAEALVAQYSRDAPDKLPLVKQALARYL
uniref:ER membrane protein complex subunit 2 n=1 Tax=Tetradesmus obliquus TaxID=3088 RepID=A0A383WLN9_TETOB|eukprot:jgi/Sobl393_1/13111/SZX78365.1